MSDAAINRPAGLIDSHFHLWPAAASVGGLAMAAGFRDGVAWGDFAAVIEGSGVNGAVAIEVDYGESLAEVDFFEAVAARAPLLKAMVAHAPLEKESAGNLLSTLSRSDFVKGVRRVTQDEEDPMFCARPQFQRSVASLSDYGLTCDICVKDFQLPGVVALAKACPNTTIVLDHFGKPEAGAGKLDSWRHAIAELAQLQNVYCKFSVIVHGWETDLWTHEVVAPMAAHVVHHFGYERLLFASNWPVSAAVINYPDWVLMAKKLTADASAVDARKLFGENAVRIYGLDPV